MTKIEYAIIGLDPSLTGFGVAINLDGKITLNEFSSKAAKTLEGRFVRYSNLVNDIIMCQYEAFHSSATKRLILLEGYSYGSKGRSILSIAEFGGVLRQALLNFGDVVEIAPTMLKKFATGKGNAGKASIVSTLANKYKMEFDSDNKADAFALVKLGEMVLGIEDTDLKYQRNVVSLVREQLEKERDEKR